MNKQIIKLAAQLTKCERISTMRNGGWCKAYHVGGSAWNEAVAKATAIVTGREVVSRRGYAGYEEGYRADGSEFCRGGIGPL